MAEESWRLPTAAACTLPPCARLANRKIRTHYAFRFSVDGIRGGLRPPAEGEAQKRKPMGFSSELLQKELACLLPEGEQSRAACLLRPAAEVAALGIFVRLEVHVVIRSAAEGTAFSRLPYFSHPGCASTKMQNGSAECIFFLVRSTGANGDSVSQYVEIETLIAK